MGDVWLARHDPLDRSVALKVLRERAARDEASVRSFVREARAASRLRHPNTIRVFDFGASDDGVFYIAMELLDGLDLETIIASGGPVLAQRFARLLTRGNEHKLELRMARQIPQQLLPGITGSADDSGTCDGMPFRRLPSGNRQSPNAC